ncbi:unnamed protein product [Phaedon cochleariae]|uniref:Thyroglobulin type-1 domain-containing protein n=1 Tax=Phaedon cochleariae TaxID=80249 RepID=A0A9P0DNF6_PHACE|nr:unnamed protein product [Phaedon cochleariae]
MNSLLIFLLFSLATIQNSSESCDDILVTDLSQHDCIAKQTNTDSYYYSLDETQSCLPSCKKYNPDGHFRDSCSKQRCPAGYTCSKRCNRLIEYAEISCETRADCTKAGALRAQCVDMCVLDADTCMAYHANTSDFRDNKFGALKFKPACDNDGQWDAKQCKGGVSGKCYCYDPKGEKLFGQALYPNAADMTCSCSRRRAELLDSGRPFVSFHCDSKGNFEKMQCDSGLCWCADPKTGELVSAVVPERVMPKLPCYDTTTLGSQYLRQCDSHQYAITKITNTLKTHGVVYANFGMRLCDGDGAYGAYNVSNGIAYCTWRDGTTINTWQSDSSTDISTLNCNCARDYKMYAHQLHCTGSGNYESVQNFILNKQNYFYCVDDDGFAISDYFTTRVDNCTSYY